jgi:hypothetical protein
MKHAHDDPGSFYTLPRREGDAHLVRARPHRANFVASRNAANFLMVEPGCFSEWHRFYRASAPYREPRAQSFAFSPRSP